MRVLNFQMRVSAQLSDVFRHAELDTVLSYMIKQACEALRSKAAKQVKETMVEKGVGMLAVYRKHCASTSSPGQLILPEALKLLPVYMGALLKTDLFRTGNVRRPPYRGSRLRLAHTHICIYRYVETHMTEMTHTNIYQPMFWLLRAASGLGLTSLLMLGHDGRCGHAH